MQFIARIRVAKSFSELQKVLLEAKKCKELNDGVIHAAIKKLTSRDCKNIKFGYELARQIPVASLPSLDRYTLESVLNCSSQENDFRLAHKVFWLLKTPNSFDFYYYINSFKNVKANELSPEIIQGLESVWKKVELSEKIDHDKLLTQLFSVLSFSTEKQRSLLNYLLSKPPNSAFTCGLFGSFLKYCTKIDDLDFARKVWDWGHAIRERESGTFRFFQVWFMFYTMFPPSLAELMDLWSHVRNSRLDCRVQLVTSMCKSLSIEVVEQRNFICHVISNEPDISFDCGLLGAFLKHCTVTKDLKLAEEIWHWGQSIRERDRGTLGFFLINYQYFELFPPSISELRSLWSHVLSAQMSDRAELITYMCSSLTPDREEQRNFILSITLREPKESFDCGILGEFLKHCSETKDLELAQDIWSWGQGIRERECKTLGLFLSTCVYYELFPPSISELKALWSQVVSAQLNDRADLITYMCLALSSDRKEQRDFIIGIISNEPKASLNCRVLGAFLKHCSETKDLKLAQDIWHWGQRTRERECGTLGFFLITYQYCEMFPPSISDLKSLWSQVVTAQLNSRVELVTAMCSALSHDRKEQRNFIFSVTLREPSPSFHRGLLGAFLKHCSETNDPSLAMDIWKWGQPIRERSSRYYHDILVTLQYLTLCGSAEEKQAFILQHISHPAHSSYNWGIIGSFLSFCAGENNLELARKVWSWGLDIRERWKGTTELCNLTIQYLCISGGSGDLSLLEEAWKEANDFEVGSFIEVKGAFISALASNSAVHRVLEIFSEVPINDLNQHILTSTLNALAHTGHDVDALDILRRVQSENPKIVSINSYNSVIDAFARNGNFQMAHSLIDEMKSHGIEPNAIAWKTILSPCRFYKNLPAALNAFEQLQRVEHEPEDMSTAYVLLADVYKSCGDTVTASQLHDERKSKGLFKVRGGIKLTLPDNNETLAFYVKEIPSTLDRDVCDQICRTLNGWTLVLGQIGLPMNSERCRHSEMLALAKQFKMIRGSQLNRNAGTQL